jgi:excinuclease ABC subunit A
MMPRWMHRVDRSRRIQQADRWRACHPVRSLASPLTYSTKLARPRRKKTEAAPTAEPCVSTPPAIHVRGARVHNLKNIDIDLPRDCLVLLTGVSGSGKSSLAFDTIYAEGRRRYLECLSSYARQFLDELERPDVDSIDGLPPTVAIDQRAGTANPRSTLGTVTEIYDYLRLLFARVGKPHCPACGVPILRQTPEQMAAQLMRLEDSQKVQILAPLVRDRKGQHVDVFQAIRRAGLIRARVDGEMIEVTDQPPKLAKAKSHTIEAVVDRISIREGIRPRLAESLDLALKLSGGGIVTLTQSPEGWDEQYLSVHLNCPQCDAGLPAIEPRSFSFNSPHGACPACEGLGSRRAFQAELAIADRSRSWDQGVVAPWALVSTAVKDATPYDATVREFLTRHRIAASSPLELLPAKAWTSFWSGEPAGAFPGLALLLEQLYQQIRSESIRKALDVYREDVLCMACAGSRLRPESRAVRIEGRSIADLTSLAIADLLSFFQSLRLEPALQPVGSPLVSEIVGRLHFLVEVGLDYLSLGRGTDTLSGGELQRARLAAQLGSGLMGVCTILDEPTAGLHSRDTDRLIVSIRRLLEQGNSILVVEHDASVIRAADWIVDLGPGAGPDGGTVVTAGTLEQLQTSTTSITARYLVNGFQLAALPSQRLASSPGWIQIRGASLNNLKHVDVQIPLGALTCVTGVSGSGKSTLVNDLLARTVRRFLHRPDTRGQSPDGILGLEAIDQLVEVDQSPIGRGPRSTPATATGLFDDVRRVFALTREAKIRGYGASRFSFNATGGRCEACHGLGQRRLPMHFLPDLHVTCEVCGGKRFNRQTLEVKFKGKSIGDILDMRVDDSRRLFDAVPRVLRGLTALHDVGLGYLTLGQSSSTLSGGEAQRIKLAAELGRATTGRALYLLDEPTTGLHFADIERLLTILHRLASVGHTVVVIEHQLDVIASADWVIDLGPEGGAAGGRVVAMGPPIAITQEDRSHTGLALRLGLPGTRTAATTNS